MLNPTAEDSFRHGVRALTSGRRREATALFEAAIRLDRRAGAATPQARYLSYYGVCVALELNDVREGLRYCREAVTKETYNPDLRSNLARVQIAAGRRREAFETLRRGLKLDRRHRGLRIQLRKMGMRRRPPLPFLNRSHPLNVFLGRLRPRPRPAA